VRALSRRHGRRHGRRPGSWSSSRHPAREHEDGAVAVELALCLPLLLMFLFAVIQYGYGLFQLQEFNAALGNASQLAATGITDCGKFTDTLTSLASQDGLKGSGVDKHVVVSFLTQDDSTSDQAQRYGLVKVTASYTPFRIGFPGIPFPKTITRSQTSPIQDIGLSTLPGC
jgi:Flp pilus assembly protein TadG